MKVPSYVSCILLIVCGSTLGVANEAPVAFIEKITGEATLKSGADRPRPLNPKSDLGLILEYGDVLNCKTGKVLGVTTDRIRPGEVSTPVDLCKIVDKLHTPESKAGLPASAMEKLQDFMLAGRDKATETAIFNPPNGGAIVAEKFVIHWRVRPPLDKFTAILEEGTAELARVPNVDGAKGELASAVLQQALERVRDSARQELRLVFKFDRGSDQSIKFSVLSSTQETQLRSALKDIEGQTGLLPYIERAAIYDSFRLYGKSAGEYDAALLEAPESRELLRASLQAHTRIGDLHRARELRDKLQQVEDATQ